MADLDELTRIAERDVGRELKGLDEAISRIAGTLEPDERVLGAVTGDWVSKGRCLAVATSRKLAVSDGKQVSELPYPTITAVELGESWRKATLLVRAPGHVADIRRVHLDRARSLHSLIQTARMNAAVR